MSIKVFYSGTTPDFLKRMAAFADVLPELTRRIDGLKLSRAYTGVKSVKFLEVPINSEKVYYDASKDAIIIHPSNFVAGDRIDRVFFKALGKRHWSLNMTSSDKARWLNMYAFARKSLIDRLAVHMKGQLTFKDVIAKFNTAVDRLVVLHILNALTKNSVTPAQLKSVDFRKHPAVKDFIEGRRPYSLRPLISTYGGDIKRMSDYTECFAEWCVNRGSFKISETSTKEEFKNLFMAVSDESRST